MNILHVTRTMDPAWGGPVEGVKNIAAQSIARGHHVEITCIDAPDAPWLEGLEILVHAIGPARYGLFGYSRRLDSWLAANTYRFDAVVANGIWMYFSAAVRRASLRAKVPYFVFTHGALDPWFKHEYPHKQLKKSLYWMLTEHKVLRDAAAVLFTTAEEQILANNAFWPYGCNPQVTGYGIQDPFVSQVQFTDPVRAKQHLVRALPTLDDRPFLLFLARIHEKKGLDLLLEAIARNRLTYQGHALVIVGPGDQHYLSELKALASQLGLDKQILWAGPLYAEAKWAVIWHAEAYVLPSHQENFGVSVAEALACGVPVLITDKVSIWREVIADNGGLVESDNPTGISRLLQRWSELPAEQKEAMHDNARQCFRRHFDVARTTEVLLDVLARHIDRRETNAVQICAS